MDSALNKLKVVAAIPCFNTELYIGEVVSRVKKYVDQVIVINDGSHDRTTQAAQDAGAIVIYHEVNRGKGAAMKFAAQEAQADIIVFIDGDGQHNADEIPSLLQPILDGQADLVIGSRFLHGSKKDSTPLSRRFANFGASVIISLIVSSPMTHKKRAGNRPKVGAANYRLIRGHLKWFTDCTGGFRAIKKDSWEKLTLVSDGYQIETEMIYEAVRNGLRLAEVPVSCEWSGSLSKLSIIKDGTRTLRLLAKRATSDFRRKTS